MPATQNPKLKIATSSEQAAHLEVAFEWINDRYLHRVEFVWISESGAQRETILTSLESSSDHPWPTSPPIQACHAQPGVGLFGTGMSGAGHWSIALTANESTLTWDVACRFKKAPGQLGSSYKLPKQWQNDGARIEAVPQGIQIPLRNGFFGRLLISKAEETAAVYRLESNRLNIFPDAISTAPATDRWLYKLRLECG